MGQAADPTTSDISVDELAFCKSLLAGQKYAAELQSACEYSLSVTRLANYLCEQRTQLGTRDLSPGPQRDRGGPLIVAQVRFVDGTESYADITVNGKPTDRPMFEVSQATGQYSSVLVAVFDPRNQPVFRFAKEENLDSRPALLYRFDVKRENNKTLWFLQSRGKVIYPGYSGKLWIDKQTGRLMRLEMESTDVPKDFAYNSKLRVDYAEVSIGDGSKFVLPMKAHTVMCNTRSFQCAHNETTFSKFRKFAAEHRILPSE